jgi:hypothetical protein
MYRFSSLKALAVVLAPSMKAAEKLCQSKVRIGTKHFMGNVGKQTGRF